MKYLATLFVLMIMISTMASAQLVKENFDYPSGEAVDSLGWTAHSGTGNSPALVTTDGLTYAGYAGSGVGKALDVLGITAEDVNKGFPALSADGTTIYLAVLVDVTASANSITGGYFMHLGNRASPISLTSFCARVFAKVDASGNVSFGLANTTTASYTSATFAKNTTYLLVVKYKINVAGADTTCMWVLGSGVPANEAAAGTPDVSVDNQSGQNTVNAVAIRQNTGVPDVVLDGIRVATTWENSVGGVDAPNMVLSPSSINFGKVLIGSHATDSITVQNIGYAALDITSATPSAAVFTITPSSASVPAQNSVKFAVKYTPTTAQFDSGNVAFVSNASSSPDTVIVKGTGKAPGFSVSPKSLNFGKVWKDSTVTDTLFVTNLSSTDNLMIDSVVVADTMYSVSPTTADIAVSASDTFIVTFKPTIKGLRTGPVLFYHDSPAVADTVPVTGLCITHEAGFLATPDTLDFNSVLIGRSKVDTITVKNDGYDSLFISSVTSSNAKFTVTPTTARLDSMASQKFTVTFTPDAEGVVSGVIAFESNASEGKDTVYVTATGSKIASIAEARKDADGNFTPDHIGEVFFLTGVITSPNLQKSSGNQTSYFMQDTSAGIDIFSFDSTQFPVTPGDSVFVAGEIAQYNGLTEIKPLSMDTANFKILKHKAVLPKPKVITAADFNTKTKAEELEGSLVEIDTLYYLSGTWAVEGRYQTLYYKPKNSTDSVRIFIDNDTNVDGSPKPEDPVNFTGILSQYTYSSTKDDVYQLIPRDTSDIVHVVLGAVNDMTNGIPKNFYLSQNYPNPFNPSTVIEFGLPKESQVQIMVYNVLGQRVALLVNDVMKAGNHRLVFSGARFASGVYFYVMRAGEKIFKHKMLLMK